MPLAFIARCLALIAITAAAQAAPDHVDITWLSITNLHFDFGAQKVLADGYVTRLPADNFFGGGGGFANTRSPRHSDEGAVREVFDALGGKPAVTLLITGHSHWDHTFDTATWARLSGARIVGSPTTCFQVRAQDIPARRCRPVFGGERIALEPGVTMYVIRWNHSGNSTQNPEQHDPVELTAPPTPGPGGALRAGVAEDFPNGGGNRAYLFRIDAPRGPFSILFQDSAGASDLDKPIVVGGRNFGAPLENLRHALAAAKLQSVDLWIATGGADVARLVLPVLKPKAYLPVHWDGLFNAFKSGPSAPYADPALAQLLKSAGVELVVPTQYGDRWRVDASGVHALDSTALKHALGLN